MNKLTSALFALCIALGSLLIVNTNAFAQATTGDVLGTVTDATGAVVPNATVTIINKGTGQSRTASSNGSGDYVFSLLPTGTYSVKVEFTGFKAFSVSTLNLSAGDRARVNAQLTTGEASSTVDVTSQSPLLQSDSSVLQDVIGQKAVQDLPLNGRNFIQLAQLTVGANEGPPGGLTSGQRPDDRRQSSSISVNGQSDILNNQLVDGMDNNERVTGTIGVRPSVEAISELRVQTNSYTAEVGRTAGGVVNVITKSGTNDLHGSVYEYFRNDKLDASAFAFGANLPKTELRQNQFGASVGGPVIHNKTFFFADYEALRNVAGQNPTTVSVPSLSQYQALRTNPASLLPAGGTLSQAGLNYALLFPAPNVPGQNAFTNSAKQSQFSTTADGRVDHHFNERDTLFVRWSYNNVSSVVPDVLPAATVAGVTVLPGGTANHAGPAADFAQQFLADYVHIFSPTLVMELRAGYTRVNNFSGGLNEGTNAATAFGIPGINISPTTSGLSPLSFSNGLAALGDSQFVPIRDVDNTFEYSGTVSYTRGAHTYKFGAAVIRRQASNTQDNQGEGAFSVAGLPQLLEGVLNNEQRANELAAPGWRYWEPSVFVQDDWHVTRWLTLNLGARYDIFTPKTEVNNNLSNFNPYTGQLMIASNSDPTAGVKTYYNSLAPRFGFAATLGQGFVLRGGFGMSYFPGDYTSDANLKNPPIVSSFGPCGLTTPCPAGFGNLSQGLPIPTRQTVNPATFTGSFPGSAYPNFVPSYIEQANLTLQKQIGANVLTASYVGMFGRHLPEIYNDLNAPGLFTGVRPFAAQWPVAGQFGETQTDGSSSYNALQVSFQRRFTKGLSIDANYTWAHEIDDVVGFSTEGTGGYGLVPGQIAKLDRGDSDLDIRNRVAIMANYQLPFGKSLRGWVGGVAKGWEINSLASWETGLPFTVLNANNISGTSLSNQGDRPNVVASTSLPSSTLSEFFNTAAFQAQPAGTLGSEARNALHGPNFRHVDLSVFKNFPLGEARNIQFRAECFNISNTPSFAAPNASLGGTQFGQITGLNVNYTPREFQLVLKFQF
ncbi:MAG TPA: carboxypeptidase regulatory-like domain-containing protein [Bryobacteraceae bacterium]|nr:carboxypeptidase regulatory-like domain-containing protein [Bryobacteraceae bacterium]